MSELAIQHAAHKARLARMGIVNSQPAIVPKLVRKAETSSEQPIKSVEDHWRNMWFGNLVFDLPEPTHIRTKEIKVKDIQEVVAKHFKTTVFLLTSEARFWSVSHPRQVAMYLARNFTKHSSLALGRYFNRDHSTILHAIKKIDFKIKNDLQVAADVASIKRQLGIRS